MYSADLISDAADSISNGPDDLINGPDDIGNSPGVNNITNTPGTDIIGVNCVRSETDSAKNNRTDSTKTGTKTSRLNQVKAKSGLRSRSFRGSFRHSISLTSGESAQRSSNHVLTERNSRVQSDPELLRLKCGDLDLRSPILSETTGDKSHMPLLRSLSSPALRMISVLDEKRKRILGNRRSQDVDQPKQLHLEGDVRTSDTTDMSKELHLEGDMGTNEVPTVLRNKPCTPCCSRSISLPDMSTQDTCVCSHGNSQRCNTKHNLNLTKNSCNHKCDCHGNHISRNDGLLNNGAKSEWCCDNQLVPGVCFVHRRTNQSNLSDCNRMCHNQTANQSTTVGSCDANGNFDQSEQSLADQLNQLSMVNSVTSHDSAMLDIPRRTSPRPWSTGSDMTTGSRSLSRSSSVTSDVSSRSSGSFDYYCDPFTPSPDILTPSPEDQKVPEFIQRPTDTPISSTHSVLKRPSRRTLAYSRHKELIRQELRLMNINEEDEITKLWYHCMKYINVEITKL